MQETQVPSLGQENPLEMGMAVHSSILAWRNSMDRGVWQAIVHGVTKTQLSDWHFHFSLFQILKKKKLQEQYKLLDPLHTNYLNENILLYFSHLWRDIFLLTWCLSPLIHVCIPKIRTLLLSITTIQTLPVKNSTLIWYSLIHRPNQISPVVLTKPPFPSQSRILSTNMYSTSLSSLISFLQSGTIPPEQFFVSQVLQSFSFRPFILKGDSTFNAAPWPKTMHSWQE